MWEKIIWIMLFSVRGAIYQNGLSDRAVKPPTSGGGYKAIA